MLTKKKLYEAFTKKKNFMKWTMYVYTPISLNKRQNINALNNTYGSLCITASCFS